MHLYFRSHIIRRGKPVKLFTLAIEQSDKIGYHIVHVYLFPFGKVPILLSTPCFLRPEKPIRILVIFNFSEAVNHSTEIVRPWDPSMLGLLNILSVFLWSDFDASSSEIFLNLARDAS